MRALQLLCQDHAEPGRGQHRLLLPGLLLRHPHPLSLTLPRLLTLPLQLQITSACSCRQVSRGSMGASQCTAVTL